MTTEFSTTSPVDDSIVWTGRATSAGQIDSAMRQAAAAVRQWADSPLEERIEVVSRYGEFLSEHRDQVSELVTREVGKLNWDAGRSGRGDRQSRPFDQRHRATS